MSDKTKDSLLVISGNIRLKVHDFFFDGTFTLAPYCSYGPCAAQGGQAATGSTLLFTNFLRRTTFLCRYMRFFFRYVPPYILGYVIRSFFRFAVTCSKKAGQKKFPFINSSRRTTFVCRYVRYLFRYVEPQEYRPQEYRPTRNGSEHPIRPETIATSGICLPRSYPIETGSYPIAGGRR